MGSLTLVSPWLPQDDLLLVKSIEAGASLEALAKGAVEFSRKFTISELKDRWRSLLYDPIISREASTRMVEFQHSVIPSKSSKANVSKETKFGNGKRKAESVRRSYCARRKRICNETLPEDDFCFLDAPSDNCFMSGAEAPGRDSILGDPMANHLGLRDANFDGPHNVYLSVTRDDFPIGQQNTFVDPMERDTVHEEVPNFIGNCTRTRRLGCARERLGHSFSEADGMEENRVDNGEAMMRSGCGGNTIFNSPICDGETSFSLPQFASSLSALDSWKIIDGMTGPEMPDNVTTRGNNLEIGDPFDIRNDCNTGEGTIERGIVHIQPELNNHISFGDLKNSTGCPDGYFTDISDSLFNSDDEMLLFDGDDDDVDLDDLKSILLSSPEDHMEDKMSSMPETTESAAANILSSPCQEEKIGACDTYFGDFIFKSNSESPMSLSACTFNPQFPELRDGVICCVLNTEDPEIPCNDDIVFPSKQRAAPVQRRPQIERKGPSLLGKNYSGTQASERGPSTMKGELKELVELHPTSQGRGQDVGLNLAVGQSSANIERSRGETLNGVRSPSTGCGGTCQSRPPVKKEPPDELGCSVAEKPGQVSESSHLQIGVGINQEAQTQSALGSVVPMSGEPGRELLLSDPENQFSESDTDIPYFSDVESMILDMDLCPGDQDLCGLEVSKYQHEDAKRAIIRLEQSARSCMQRDIASHGAFAVLYGRHSKHYIKKPKVLLGRATEGVTVDIDLGREGHGNKISRRQALIKMDRDGTFNLKNMGQRSIYVNCKEISPGECFKLYSNCLIEIRGMPFIFEINQARVKLYLEKNAAL